MAGYPGHFRELLGLRVDEFVPLKSDRPESIDFEGKFFKVEVWSEVINLEGANALATFTSGFTANKPAITCHSFSKGKAYYISTLLESNGINALYTKVLEELNIHPIIQAPAGVEIVQRGEYIFLLNHNFEPVTVRLGTFFGKNLLGEETHFDKITLSPNGTAILQK